MILIIILSIVFLALGIFVLLISVNYSWYIWEEERVESLSNRISSTKEDTLMRKNTIREYTQSFDIKSATKSGAITANKAIKTLVTLSKEEYPNLVSKIKDIFSRLRKDFFATIKEFIAYLLRLAKPDPSPNPLAETQKKADIEAIDEAINKVKESRSHILPEENIDLNLRLDTPQSADADRTISPLQVKYNGEDINKQTATIGLSDSTNSQTKSDNGLFEKLESRILEKMKQSGLNNYNLWLELGDLYLKFGEKSKASECYALVLKNTEDDKEKEMALNKLIGL